MLVRIFLTVLCAFCVFEASNGIIFDRTQLKNLFNSGALDLNFYRCMIQNTNVCPHPDVVFKMYTSKGRRSGVKLHPKNPYSLYTAGFSKQRETVFIIHGFNGSASDKHLVYLRDAYVYRDFNVITVDWNSLTRYPCYISALVNTRLAAQCSAQIYAFITHHGVPNERITCVGHSLGAHVCGMISNHITTKQYRIIGLDPARPLIERKKSNMFRLDREDAAIVQIMHTNAGFLGQRENTGHLNYCVNGGNFQPYCKGQVIRRARCSHYLSICFLANALFKRKRFLGVPCPHGCVDISGPRRLPVSSRNPFQITKQIVEMKIGNDAPDDAYGIFCVDIPFAKHCPFNDLS